MTDREASARQDVQRLRGARVLVTGAAGFIGFATSEALLGEGVSVLGVDNLCEVYYSAALKHARLARLRRHETFEFAHLDLRDGRALGPLDTPYSPTHILHLAAHAAVLPSFEAPLEYVGTNVMGTQQILEALRGLNDLVHVVYASTSSVYGRSVDGTPFREDQPTVAPISPYGASKIANEAMMQTYADHFGWSVTGLRFFKVYGPWGRPDTVFFKLTDRVARGLPVALHNRGEVSHAFTYIDDIVDGTVAALARPARHRPDVPHPRYNLGTPRSRRLPECLDLIEEALGRKATRELVDLPPGDRAFSVADVSLAEAELGYSVDVEVEEGIPRLVRWYRESYPQITPIEPTNERE